MSHFFIAAVLAFTSNSELNPSYAQAYHASREAGQPLVVLVGADWCPACVRMKDQVLPTVRQQGALDGVAYTQVDLDRENKLARKLMRGGTIPQLVVFHKNGDRWERQQFIGYQSVSTVLAAIDRAKPDVAPAPSIASSDMGTPMTTASEPR